jgi:hypothetical protein
MKVERDHSGPVTDSSKPDKARHSKHLDTGQESDKLQWAISESKRSPRRFAVMNSVLLGSKSGTAPLKYRACHNRESNSYEFSPIE